jgi:putative hemolysin
MDSFPLVEVLIIFALILANSFFAASEIAVVSARRSRLQQEIDNGKKGAVQALKLSENSDRFLATVQVGITLISNIASAYGGASVSNVMAQWINGIGPLQPYSHTIAFTLVVLLITYFSLVIGELTPKRMALQSAEAIAIAVAPFMTWLSITARPVIALLTFSVNIVLRILGQHKVTRSTVTAEDIVYMAHEGTESGTVETTEEAFIYRVFQFTDQSVSSIMMPRTEIVAVEANTPLADVVETFMSSGYTRLPLYEGTLDNIIGVLYAKDLLRARSQEQKETLDLRTIARPPFFISEFQHVDDLLNTFRRKAIHMAIVIDEYSQVTGLVTLEDVLEELVGEIHDEYDEPDDSEVIKREDGSWLVDAMIDQAKIRAQLGMPPRDETERGDYHTLAGMLLAHSGRIPKTGDTVVIGDFIFNIVDMDGRRIDKVLIYNKENPHAQEFIKNQTRTLKN